MMRNSIAPFGLLALVFAVLCSRPAQAATYFWTLPPGQPGDWSIASNWGGLVPTGTDTAYIANSGTATISLPGETCGTLSLGSTAGAGTLLMSGGSLIASSNQYIGDSGIGTFTQSSGTNSAATTLLGNKDGSSGSYNLRGTGVLSDGFELVVGNSGSGNFMQSGGTNSLGYDLLLGSSTGGTGSYVVSSGLLHADRDEFVGYFGMGGFTQSGGTNSGSSNLAIGFNSGAIGSYNLTGGSLYSSTQIIGFYGTGSFMQSGGTNSVYGGLEIGAATVGSGRYILSGSGKLTAGGEYVGYFGAGSFMQSAGTNSTSFVYLGYKSGSSGSYNLIGGSLYADEFVGISGTGSITQSGGTNRIELDLVLGSGTGGTGRYFLSGGLLESWSNEYVGDSGLGSFAQSGGTNSTDKLFVGSSGSYNLSGGLLFAENEYVSNSGTGSFTQSAGANSVSGTLCLTFTSGANNGYNLTGGSLYAGSQYVGSNGVASFTQSGGTNSVSNALYLGSGTVSNSCYNLSGSGRLSSPNEYLGYSGAGNFTQSGGTNTVSKTLDLGSMKQAGSGSYYLSGGILALGGSGLTAGGGTAAFYFSGGTLQADSSWSTTVPITLPTSGGIGTFDTNGHTLTLNGPLTGPGGLAVVGGGRLVLNGSNSYLGPTSVVSGTLIVANPKALPNGTNLTVGEGWLFNPATSRWAIPISGTWSDASKWTDDVPNSPQTTAVITAATSTAVTIVLDEPVTLRSLQLGNSGSASTGYTLGGSESNTLTLNNSGSGATVVVTDGTHLVNAPVALDDNLEVASGGTKSWSLSFGAGSSITDNGAAYSLTMNGRGGSLVLSGTDSYTGGTIVEAGTLVATNPRAIADGSNLTIGNAGAFPAAIVASDAPAGSLAVAVPEPGTFALIAAFAVGLLVCGSRRRTCLRYVFS
jgi:autotransporter-associated beta strand protein